MGRGCVYFSFKKRKGTKRKHEHGLYRLHTAKTASYPPPKCRGRWHFRKKMTEGLLLTSPIVSHDISANYNPSVSYR